jgi:hypothetical protein
MPFPFYCRELHKDAILDFKKETKFLISLKKLKTDSSTKKNSTSSTLIYFCSNKTIYLESCPYN